MSETLNREYHELLGWRVIEDVGSLSGFPPGAHNWTWIPRLDQSSDLCIAELDRVFGKDWIMTRDKMGFCFGVRMLRDGFEGDTFIEAALRALIAAHKRDGGEGA